MRDIRGAEQIECNLSIEQIDRIVLKRPYLYKVNIMLSNNILNNILKRYLLLQVQGTLLRHPQAFQLSSFLFSALHLVPSIVTASHSSYSPK